MVSLAFHIRPRSTVFRVNLISNMIFNLLLILSTAMLRIPYLFLAAAGEIIIAWAEYSVYRRRIVSCGKLRMAVFTVTANLISLLLGIGLNYMLSGMGFYLLSQLL